MDIKNAKIGLVSSQSFKKPGGVQNHVLGLYREFKKRGIFCKIIIPGPMISKVGVDEKDVIAIGISSAIPANGSMADISMSVLPGELRKIQLENFDILHFHNLSLGPLSFQILGKSKAIHILTVHTADDGSWLFTHTPFLKSILASALKKHLHGVIGVSRAAFGTFEKYWKGPTRLIPNGIDLKQFVPIGSKIPKFVDSKKNLLFVGRFEKRKGLPYLLRAYEYIRTQRADVRLVIVGDGESRKKIEKFIGTHNLPDVALEGFVGEEALPAYYRSAAVFCAPSLFGESFGIVLLEAMASGAPIVGFANAGYRDLMEGHETATRANLLSEPKDWQDMAQKIELLLSNSEICGKAKEWGLARSKEFAWPHVADQVLEFYKEILKKITTQLRD